MLWKLGEITMVITSASLVSLDSHQAGCEGDYPRAGVIGWDGGDWEAVRITQASGDESQK